MPIPIDFSATRKMCRLYTVEQSKVKLKWQMFLSHFFIDNQFKVFVIEILTILLGFSSWADNIPTITEDNKQKYWLFVKKLFSLHIRQPHGHHVTKSIWSPVPMRGCAHFQSVVFCKSAAQINHSFRNVAIFTKFTVLTSKSNYQG